MYILQQCYINISPYHHIKIDEDDGFPPPHPHRLVNLIRVWPGWFFLLLAWFGHWLLLLLGAQISGLDPPAHILSVKGALWKTGCKNDPKNVKKKKRRMQKMSQIPESLTGGWKEVPLCIQLAKSGNQGGIVDIARMLR